MTTQNIIDNAMTTKPPAISVNAPSIANKQLTPSKQESYDIKNFSVFSQNST